MPSPLYVILSVTSTLTLLHVIAGDYGVELEHMTSLQVPSHTEEEGREWRFDSGSVKAMSYDEVLRILYVVGGSTIQYINVSNPSQLAIIGHTSFPNTTFYDVNVCGEYVLATYSMANQSGLLVARGYHPANRFPVLIRKMIYDVLEPVSLAMTSDCKTAVVAISGKASWDGRRFVDPEAAVVIVSLPALLSRESAAVPDPVAVVDFRVLDDRIDQLVESGVHFPMKERGGRLSRDLDPSDVIIDDVTKQAYVTLQVNNAVAIVDLASNNLTRVVPLGLKDWVDLPVDLSDKDGVRFQQRPIYSMYQPGALCLLRHSGATYLLTANSGAKRDYSHIINLKEDITGMELIEKDLVGPYVEPELVSALGNASEMGSLHFTKHNGVDELPSGSMSKFVIFGARSFSLRELPDLDLTYDSGSDLELRMAQRAPGVFNCPAGKSYTVVTYDSDLSSATMGPEPTKVTTGRLGALPLLMVGLGNPGGVLLYSLDQHSLKPVFRSHWLGVENYRKSWGQLYAGGRLGGIHVTDLIYVPSPLTGHGVPLLLVAGCKSGTVSVLRIKGIGDIPYDNSAGDLRLQLTAVVLLLALLSLVLTE